MWDIFLCPVGKGRGLLVSFCCQLDTAHSDRRVSIGGSLPPDWPAGTSLLLIYVAEPSPLWVLPSPGRWAGLCKKRRWTWARHQANNQHSFTVSASVPASDSCLNAFSNQPHVEVRVEWSFPQLLLVTAFNPPTERTDAKLGLEVTELCFPGVVFFGLSYHIVRNETRASLIGLCQRLYV